MTEELSKGFTGIEINGVRFSNIKEMLVYMDKQRNEIILLEKENAELEKELKAEKEFNATLRKEIDEYTNSHTLCVKYKELEKKISILLSCKNCPDNKGGSFCQKEYDNKCLAQKIQYIKELKEENEELKAENEANENGAKKYADFYFETNDQLTKAKKLIKKMLYEYLRLCVIKKETIAEAKQFLKE